MSRLHACRLSLAIALGLALSPSAFAADAATLQARAGSNGIELVPSLQAPAWQLRLSGPGGAIGEDSFLAGEPLLLQPALLRVAQWADGQYLYELSPVLGDRERRDGEATPALAGAPGSPLSGSFTVIGGHVFVAGAGTAEAPAGKPRAAATGGVTPQDVVTADDGAFQGSLCVGTDCIDGEAFGFDTIRVKENNTRIGFDDTSVGAFPANDWTLGANDSASGGLNRFYLEDVTGARIPFSVLAGAPNNSLYVDSTGRIGLGTATPAQVLHLQQPNTPVVRLEQDSSGGFTAQTWDVGGNESNFFVRDVTAGNRLPFRIRRGAPSSSLQIGVDGNVGVGGTTVAATALQVFDDGNKVALRLTSTAPTPGLGLSWDIFQSATSGRINFTDDTTGVRIPVKFAPNALNNLLRVGLPATNVVEVNGNLNVNGNIVVTGSVGPDYVFGPGFALPSIGDHADYMLANHHLPKVGAARVNEAGQGVMDLGTLSHGMLEELEYAHLYIAQLDGTVQELRDELAARDEEVARRDAELAQMREEIREIQEKLAD